MGAADGDALVLPIAVCGCAGSTVVSSKCGGAGNRGAATGGGTPALLVAIDGATRVSIPLPAVMAVGGSG